MKYLVSHICGHRDWYDLYGPVVQRNVRIDKLHKRSCTSCQRDHDRVAALASAQNMALPALIGSERQVDWALIIRFHKLEEVSRARRALADEGRLRNTHPEILERVLEEFDNAAALLSGITQTRWWIDHRDEGVTALLRESGTA